MLAAVDHTTDAGQVAHLEFRHVGADRGYAADNLMAGHRRVQGVVPLIARGVQVGVADAAVEDIDLYVIRPWRTALKGKGFERILGIPSGVAVSLGHLVHLLN